MTEKTRLLICVAQDKRSEVENIIKKDDELSRLSITIRSAESLDINDELKGKFFFLIEGNENVLRKAKEVLKDYEEELSDERKNEIISKIKEVEESAIEGFGSIIS
jgi:hypothetical protein